MKRLFEVLAGPLGQPRTPGSMFGGYRTVSFDGCKSLKVPDTAANRAWPGKHNLGRGEAGYPALLLMTLVETGTRALIGAVFGSQADGEAVWARKLLPLLDATMLLLADRGFDDGPFLAAVAARKAQFLVRAVLPLLEACIAENHPYFSPDIRVLPIMGNGGYVAWISREVGAGRADPAESGSTAG